MGGSLLIPPSAARVLDNFGAWERILAADLAPTTHTTYRYADGEVLESINYAALQSRFGYPVMAVTRERYQRELFLEAINAGVEVRFACRVRHINETGPSVILTSGEHIEGDLIIGADGIKSTVRTVVLGSNDVEPIPEAVAYQFEVPSQAMKSSPVTAPLMEGSLIHSWYGPDRHLISGTSSRGDSYVVTVTVYPAADDNIADTLNVLAANTSSSYRHGDVSSLIKRVEMFEPRVRKIAELVKPEDCFLWKLAYIPKLDSWVSPSGRVTILGDAAHAMVPHLGMGAATAVEDGGVLVECLGRARSPDDIPLALSAYQKIRKPRAEQIQSAALATGIYKALKDGTEQRQRDRKMAERMDPGNPKHESWKAGGGLDWLYAYDVVESSKKELDTIFGAERRRNKIARL